jgi:cell division protein FtsI/penicillin-binding protein 2
MDATEEKEERNAIGRRRFLKSLFGLGAVSEAADAEAEAAPAKKQAASSFFWVNLRNGQIGFPTGMSVPVGMPGSVMKLVTAAALRESNIVTDSTTVECRGRIDVRRQTYSCLYPHGKVDLTKAIGLSCNVFFATMSQQLSSTAILDYAKRFGLNAPIAGFPSGKFPCEPRKDSVPYALGLSDDLQPNALHLLRISALVALRGTTPPLHNAVDAPRESDVFTTTLSPATWQILQQGMRMSARSGTAQKVDPEDKLHAAFKTGTAPHGKAFQSWIIGYFPADKPSYAFSLRAPSGTSQETAVPEAKKFLLGQNWPV